MKIQIIALAIILFIRAGIGGCNQSNTQDVLITVDVTASYPEKELILQDFMDVEYIPLETNDDLKGKLKDIAAELDEGSNPVIMVMK